MKTEESAEEKGRMVDYTEIAEMVALELGLPQEEVEKILLKMAENMLKRMEMGEKFYLPDGREMILELSEKFKQRINKN